MSRPHISVANERFEVCCTQAARKPVKMIFEEVRARTITLQSVPVWQCTAVLCTLLLEFAVAFD